MSEPDLATATGAAALGEAKLRARGVAVAAAAHGSAAAPAHGAASAPAHGAASAPARSALGTTAGAANQAWLALHQDASAPYRQSGRFAWYFARGKLGRDPVFRAMLERGDLAAGARVLDIGCGQGLLASLLQACDGLAQRGRWPANWPALPSAVRYTGIELMARDVERATSALGTLASTPHFVCADMCHAELPPCNVVVMLDVLHYVDHTAQAELLVRVRSALVPRGRLLLRVGDAGRTWAHAMSQLVDRGVTLIRGHRAAPTWGRSLVQWSALLSDLGFAVQTVPMSQGTPFANVLLVCDLDWAAR